MLQLAENSVDQTLIAAINILQSGDYVITEQVGEKDGFLPIRQVTTTTAVSSTIIIDSIKANVKRPLKRFHEHREFKNIKSKHQRIAIVGGGPSLKTTLQELRDFETILVAGSPHDYLISHGIIPDFCAICDPDPISANYLKYPRNSVEYFIASGCDSKVFDTLKDKQVYMWHCYGDMYVDFFREIEPGCHLIGGGCTIGLRAINLAIMMGYTNIHLFGMDSCMKEDEYHAYGLEDKEELKGLGGLMEVKIDPNSNKKYKVAGYQLAQAEHFADFFFEYHNMVSFTFHGDGLLRDLHEKLKDDIQRQTKEVL